MWLMVYLCMAEFHKELVNRSTFFDNHSFQFSKSVAHAVSPKSSRVLIDSLLLIYYCSLLVLSTQPHNLRMLSGVK